MDRLRGLLGPALDARLAQGEVLPLDEALATALDEDSGEHAA
jgi:hypothetical protein